MCLAGVPVVWIVDSYNLLAIGISTDLSSELVNVDMDLLEAVMVLHWL